MNKVIAVLFAVSCAATAYFSASILGPGMWFWIIIGTGIFVVISQLLTDIPLLVKLGSVLAGLLSFVSICAVALGLLAATIGGSFHLDDREAALLFFFFLIAVFGFILARIVSKSV